MPKLFKRNKSPYWFIECSADGKRYRRSTKTANKKEAERMLHSVADKINRGAFVVQDEIPAPQFAEKYLIYSQNHKSKSSYITDRVTVTRFFKMFNYPLKKICTLHVEEFISSEIKKGKKNSSVNRAIEVLKAMFNKAVQWNYLSQNPAGNVKKLPNTTKKLPRFLSDDEIRTVLPECSPWLRSIVTTLILTGLRVGELANLTWNDINFKQQRIHIQSKDGWTPKTYEIRTIPMHIAVYNILQKLPKDKKYVFSSLEGVKINSNNLQKRYFKKVITKLNLKNVTIHTLRHTFASHLIMKGVDILTVSKLLGHASTKTTEIYSHIAPDHFNAAIERLSLPIIGD